MARGYVNDKQLTEERFIANPFASQEHPNRLYKTGDLARYLPDGQIDFLGRIDHQVKIHGMRIELGEIEAVLKQHPTVQDAAVILHEERQGVENQDADKQTAQNSDKRLIAYCTVDREVNTEAETGVETASYPASWRRFLQERLPYYMIPSTFIQQDALPLTPHGKVERDALPSPQSFMATRADTYVAPRTSVEERLAAIWAETLDVEQVGVYDNFFELGGHSLLTTQLIAQIRHSFQVDLPLRTLFDAPTIADIAHFVDPNPILDAATTSASLDMPTRSSGLPQMQPPPLPPHLISLQTAGVRPPLFFMPPVAGVIFPYIELALQLGVEQPVYGLQSVGIAGEAQPVNRIEEMAATYVNTIRQVQPKGPYQLGGWSFGGVIGLEVAQQLHQAGQEVALLAVIDAPLYRPASFMEKARSVKDFTTLILPHLWPYVADYFNQQRNQSQPGSWLKAAQMLLDQPEFKQLRRVLCANTQAGRYYRPQRYPGRVTLLKTTTQYHQSETWGWGDIAEYGVDIQQISGHHMNILRQPYVQILAKELKNCLV